VKYIRNLLDDLGFQQQEATLIWEDNRAAILVAEQETSSAGRCKHIDTRFRFVSEAIRQRVVRVRYTPTDMNVADLFTKPLTTAVFDRLLKRAREVRAPTVSNGYEDVQVCIGPQLFIVVG
jgi:hypothetical protein